MRILLRLAYVVLLLFGVAGAINAGVSIFSLWMMLSGDVKPGAPVFLDELAPDSLRSVVIALVVALLLMGISLFGCWKIRQRLKRPETM